MTDHRVAKAMELHQTAVAAYRGRIPETARLWEVHLGNHLAAAFAKCDADYAAMRELVVNGGTEIARLTAELESSNAMCASLSVTVKDLTNAVAATIAAHMAELEEARKDAERLDWLLPNLHPATWGMEFEGGYACADDAEFLRKWRNAIDGELSSRAAAMTHAAPKAPGASS